MRTEYALFSQGSAWIFVVMNEAPLVRKRESNTNPAILDREMGNFPMPDRTGERKTLKRVGSLAQPKEPFVPELIRLDWAASFAPDAGWKDAARSRLLCLGLRAERGVKHGQVVSFDRHNEAHPAHAALDWGDEELPF
jgi:hypothetical protein